MSDVTVLHVEKPTARKEHWCSNCGRVIEVGEVYERQDNVWEGMRYAFKVCAHCRVATARAFALADWWPDEGPDWDWIESILCDNRQTVSDLRLLINYRRHWRDGKGRLVPLPPNARPEGEPE